MRQYCITGISKLTRKREIITVPCSKVNADDILKREKRKPARRRGYVYLRMEVYNPQMDFKFDNNDRRQVLKTQKG